MHCPKYWYKEERHWVSNTRVLFIKQVLVPAYEHES